MILSHWFLDSKVSVSGYSNVFQIVVFRAYEASSCDILPDCLADANWFALDFSLRIVFWNCRLVLGILLMFH